MHKNRHCEEYNVLGFDCEWIIDQYGVRQNVALVQLASHRGLCVLIRLCEFGKIPTELQVKNQTQHRQTIIPSLILFETLKYMRKVGVQSKHLF